MKELIDKVNSLPLLIKLILCIPAVEIFYGVCRIINGAVKNDAVWLILAILTVFPGAFFMWVVDVIWVLVFGHAFLLGDSMFA